MLADRSTGAWTFRHRGSSRYRAHPEGEQLHSGCANARDGRGRDSAALSCKYAQGGQPVIRELHRVSTPGLRQIRRRGRAAARAEWAGHGDREHLKGLMTDREARRRARAASYSRWSGRSVRTCRESARSPSGAEGRHGARRGADGQGQGTAGRTVRRLHAAIRRGARRRRPSSSRAHRTSPSTRRCTGSRGRSSPTWSKASPQGSRSSSRSWAWGTRRRGGPSACSSRSASRIRWSIARPRASSSRRRSRRRSSSKARTKKWSARWRPSCAACVRPSRTRGKASSMSASRSGGRRARREAK